MYLWQVVSPVPKYRRTLGEAIRSHRKRAGLSQESLAERAELHPVYVSAVERGVKTISMDALMRLARALDVRLHELVRDL